MARPFGRDRRGSNSKSSISNIKLQSGGRTRRSKKRGKTKERLLLVVGLIVVVLIVLRKKVTKKKKKIFPNQKLEQGKNNQKGLSLDPQRNHQNHHQQLHFQHHQHNQNQTQNQILISRQVVEGLEKEQEQQEQEQEASEKEEPSSFHGFHNQYFQQAQEFHQQHQFLYGVGLESQSSQPPPQPPKKRSYLPSSSSQSKEYASGLRGKMGDTTTTSQNHQTTSSRLGGLRNTVVVGEIVEVQGGHIVRSTGRKDRHSKVCTAKGPRDRRVRLSAHTAIQFYDVQDRLGYDRPSKVVDWLIKKAKAAIDELEELPAWTPTANSIPINPPNAEQEEDQNHNQHHQQQLQQQQQQHLHHSIGVGSTSNARQLNDQQQQPNENNSSSFLPPSMDSGSVADTIKSFFPMGASTETNSSSAAANIQFHHNFPPPDLLSRTSCQSQDLRLSLQSFQYPMFVQHHNHQNQQQNEQAAGLFSGNPQMGFDGSGWSENPPGEMGRFQRMVTWNASGDTGHSGGGGAFVLNSPPAQPAQPMLQPLFGQSHQLFFSQRGPLQSSNTPSVRAWIDPSAFSAASDHHQNQASLPFHPSSISGIGFASGGGFSGFRIPARIQGEEEEHDGISDKPSSASSDSRH